MKIFFVFNEGCFPNITIYRNPWSFRVAWVDLRSREDDYACANEWGHWEDKWQKRAWVVKRGPCGFFRKVE